MSKTNRAMIKPLRDHLVETFRASIPSVDKNKGKWGETFVGLAMILLREPNREFVTIADVILGLKAYGNGSCRSTQAIQTCMRIAASKGLFVASGRKSSQADYTLPSQYREVAECSARLTPGERQLLHLRKQCLRTRQAIPSMSLCL